MKAIVHIGLTKTGTTTLQNFFQENQRALARQGIFYKRYSSRANHTEFMMCALHRMGKLVEDLNLRSALGGKDMPTQTRIVEKMESKLRADMAASNCDVALISCEILSWPQRQEPFVRAVHAWMSERFSDVTYILYLREQASWIASSYSQSVRVGEIREFEEFLDGFFVPNLNLLVRRWEDVAGAENVRLRLFEREAMKNGDLIDDFCDAAGIRMEGLARTETLNEKLTLRQIELYRRGNALVARVVNPGRASRMLRYLTRGVFRVLFATGTGRLELTEARRAAIQAEAQRSNENLRRRRFPDRVRLFADGLGPPPGPPPGPGKARKRRAAAVAAEGQGA